MKQEHEFFSPEQVEEQIDHLYQSEAHPFSLRKAEQPAQAEKRLVADLRGYYRTEKQEDLVSLERAWKRVSPHLDESTERTQGKQVSLLKEKSVSPERNHLMYPQKPERSARPGARRWLSMLAAVLVAAVLVGGLVAVLNMSHRSQTAASSPTGPASQPTATPTAQPIGTTVYTAPASKASYTNFYWSPDSKRIASFSGYGTEGLRIWDATTGGHEATFSLAGSSEWIMSVAWSPVNQQIAVGTNKRLLLIDGQTGAIQHSYTSSTAMFGAFHTPYMSSMLPASSGAGFRSLNWSPDGKELAASVSDGPSGVLQIWNVQAGSVSTTLSLPGSYVITSASWSSDGKYLAAHGFNTQAIDPTAASDIVVVWDASSHQTVFKRTLMLDGSDAPLSWQPQSHNLAFISEDNSNQILTLGIWDVLANKKIHTYAHAQNDGFTFSPDGQRLACVSFAANAQEATGVISVIDVDSGAQIYTYKGGNTAPVWSPDGKYIVSAFNGKPVFDKQGHPVFKNGVPETNLSYARVWIA